MKVLLRQDHENLGKRGDVVSVKNGFARNFLFPRGIALEATPSSERVIEEERRTLARRQDKDRKAAEIQAKDLEAVSVTAAVAVGEEDRVFGSVTSQTIADLLQEKGYAIDKRKILLDEPIKALGVYSVPIKIHPEVEVKVRLWVVKE
ncbi:MAG: 50S ribosomal protein L9 [bacterium]|nr:50S ribosomal protein L9 [bacterium]